MTRAFQRQKPTSKTAAKKEAKVGAYDAVPKTGPNEPKTRPVYVRYGWDNDRDCLVTNRRYFFTPTSKEAGWYILGSIDEMEARENAGQRSMF
ncbi:hypothetical protein ASF70_12690 [Rhizobium sp. Leaf321]|uniref:hypothetical protein n=1 Tax=Rhizobium sp. Leaf321 TaxID=1736335 RepID=UPI0007159A24|nr:hypothetical protein [Rhizobium sp. Leaf321]KQQ72385.1 hypothetical protein ASF70_12690 [Rhizobium sp. Leaf321]